MLPSSDSDGHVEPKGTMVDDLRAWAVEFQVKHNALESLLILLLWKTQEDP